MNRSHLVVLAALLLTFVMTPPTLRAEDPLTKVTLQLNWLPEPEFGGIYQAQIGGNFKKHGLDVEILKGGPDVPAVQMTASGRVTFGIAAADEVIALREKGGDIVATFATYQTSPQGIMVHESHPAKDIPSLLKSEGRLAVQPGLAYVKFFKQKYGEWKIKEVPYQGGVTLFLNDKNFAQQCFVFSEPIAAARQKVKSRVFLIADTGFNPYTAVVITRGDYVKSNRAVVDRLSAALQEGWRAYLDNPAAANAVMQKLNPSMDAQTFADAAKSQISLIENDDTKKLGLGAMTRERWETLANQLVELKVVKTKVSADACFVSPAVK